MSFSCMNLGIWDSGGHGVAAVNYNGTTNYLNRGANLNGIADSPTGILSFWIKASNTGELLISIGNQVISIQLIADGGGFLVRIVLGSGSGATMLYQSSTTSSFSSWINILSSWNTNFSAGNKLQQLYISDSSNLGTVVDGSAAFSIGYSSETDWLISAATATPTGLYTGCLSEIYFAPDQYLDFSVTANRRLFISGTGSPVPLGVDGSIPTGTAPRIYFRDAAASAGNNSGNGGNFTTHGSFSNCGTHP